MKVLRVMNTYRERVYALELVFLAELAQFISFCIEEKKRKDKAYKKFCYNKVHFYHID